ncbi:MAG: nucleoside-diphosphate sugar epimerase/dehydratase [Candidatus Izemoplasmatales bacterium]
MNKSRFNHNRANLNKSKVSFMFIDALSIAFTYSFSILVLYFLRVEYIDVKHTLMVLPFVIVFKLVLFYIFKIYHLVLDNVGLDEVVRISLVVTLSNFIIILITLFVNNFDFIYEPYFIFTTLLEVLTILIPRIIRRLIAMFTSRNAFNTGNRTLIIGAGAGGKIALNEIRNNPQMFNRIIGFVDDEETKIGNLMSGYPIFGPLSEIPKIIDKFDIEEVIMAIVNIEPQKFQDIINTFIDRPVRIRRLPSLKDYKVNQVDSITDVNVEDLLSREVVELDTAGIKDFIEGKRIIVTGAGGSIGSELVRQIVTYKPKSLLLVDIYENGIYDLLMELNIDFNKHIENKIDITLQIASVYNYQRMEKIVSEYLPDYIFHAAAYKHVPLMEGSPAEAVRTNVLGTYNMCKLADLYKVKKFVLVSSDKAVRPTNIMGATKRFAEMIIQSFSQKSNTSYSAVRFGNVLGSNGSVVPLFKRQIANGGPVTVTDPSIIRYFMTIPEAVGLILQSAVYADGGEIFILDMGEPVKIIDLAEKMIFLSGFKPYVDIQIKITGLRPGEKLFEELLVDKEHHLKTDNKLIYIEKLNGKKDVENEAGELIGGFEGLDNLEIKELVQKFVPTYTIDNKK